jgi:hypothetical protein
MSWLDGRIDDFWRWPRTGVRLFWRRAGRVAALLRSGRLLPGQWRVHALVCAMFDLAGGPELTELGLRLLLPSSPLSTAEREAISSVLGPRALRYDEIRVAEGGLLRWIFARNGNRAFCLWHTIFLPQTGRHTRAHLDLLVHEATHTFQYERIGTVYIGEALAAQRRLKRRAYDYGGPDGLRRARKGGRPYAGFNREQQAQIAQHYYARRAAGKELHAYDPYIAALRQGDL